MHQSLVYIQNKQVLLRSPYSWFVWGISINRVSTYLSGHLELGQRFLQEECFQRSVITGVCVVSSLVQEVVATVTVNVDILRLTETHLLGCLGSLGWIVESYSTNNLLGH